MRAARATVATAKHFMIDVGRERIGGAGKEWNEGGGGLGWRTQGERVLRLYTLPDAPKGFSSHIAPFHACPW